MKNTRSISQSKLLSPHLDPSFIPNEKLFYWNIRPRNPVLASNDVLANMFIQGILTGEVVKFVYCGGSTPGSTRSIKPSLVFQHEEGGRIYVMGYCPEREANRVFALDLVMVYWVWN
jgi:predicted DNA-binding transcriptional regulator YafY